jgi:hypothetical protein
MSFIDTVGRSPCFLTRAQNWAITKESAPRSLKKWLSAGTCSTRTTPASTSARRLSVSVPGSVSPPSWRVEMSAGSAVKTSTDFSST